MIITVARNKFRPYVGHYCHYYIHTNIRNVIERVPKKNSLHGSYLMPVFHLHGVVK